MPTIKIAEEFLLDLGHTLPELEIVWEEWGDPDAPPERTVQGSGSSPRSRQSPVPASVRTYSARAARHADSSRAGAVSAAGAGRAAVTAPNRSSFRPSPKSRSA